MRPASEIKLVPGYNTGSPEKPCPECLTETRWHAPHCRHYLYQQQWIRPAKEKTA